MLARPASRLVPRSTNASTRVRVPLSTPVVASRPTPVSVSAHTRPLTTTTNRAVALTSQPSRAYNWSKFFENAKDPADEDWGVTPEEKESVVQMLNETELELAAQLEPLWGESHADSALAANLKSQIEQWEQFIRSTPEVKPIDFNYYRSRADPKLVDELEAEYKKIQLNDQVVDIRSSFDAHYKALEKRYADLGTQISTLVTELDTQIGRLQDRKARISTLTLEDILNERPELQEQVVAEVEADGHALHNLLRYKGDLQYEAQYKAQEEYHDTHDHGHH